MHQVGALSLPPLFSAEMWSMRSSSFTFLKRGWVLNKSGLVSNSDAAFEYSDVVEEAHKSVARTLPRRRASVLESHHSVGSPSKTEKPFCETFGSSPFVSLFYAWHCKPKTKIYDLVSQV